MSVKSKASGACRILQLEMRLRETLSRCKGQAGDAHETSAGEKLKQAGGRKSRGGSDTHSHAWAFCEAICIGNKTTTHEAFCSLSPQFEG